MLTDLIKERHWKWLGDVEWGQGDSRERLVTHNGDYWCEYYIEGDENGEWYPVSGCSAHIASCILEHAIRDKLGVVPQKYDQNYEDALIAALDALIERKEE